MTDIGQRSRISLAEADVISIVTDVVGEALDLQNVSLGVLHLASQLVETRFCFVA